MPTSNSSQLTPRLVAENGSGGFMSDLVFNGGAFGICAVYILFIILEVRRVSELIMLL